MHLPNISHQNGGSPLSNRKLHKSLTISKYSFDNVKNIEIHKGHVSFQIVEKEIVHKNNCAKVNLKVISLVLVTKY